jgi:hypothetical protein
MRGVKLRARYVMNRKPALFDYREDFLQPDLTAIIDLQGASRNKPAINNGKRYSVKYFLASSIERSVYEYARGVGVPIWQSPYAFPCHG